MFPEKALSCQQWPIRWFKNSLSTRDDRLLSFLIANEEPIVKATTMYLFMFYCGDLRKKFGCQLITLPINCECTPLLMTCLAVLLQQANVSF